MIFFNEKMVAALFLALIFTLCWSFNIKILDIEYSEPSPLVQRHFDCTIALLSGKDFHEVLYLKSRKAILKIALLDNFKVQEELFNAIAYYVKDGQLLQCKADQGFIDYAPLSFLFPKPFVTAWSNKAVSQCDASNVTFSGFINGFTLKAGEPFSAQYCDININT